jgi:hypothetical protein
MRRRQGSPFRGKGGRQGSCASEECLTSGRFVSSHGAFAVVLASARIGLNSRSFDGPPNAPRWSYGQLGRTIQA